MSLNLHVSVFCIYCAKIVEKSCLFTSKKFKYHGFLTEKVTQYKNLVIYLYIDIA